MIGRTARKQSEPEKDPTVADESAATPVLWRKTVLIVEDEDDVRDLACEFMKSAGHTVLAAKDGAEALTIAEKSDQPIHLLVTDVAMPRMRGPELAKRLKVLRKGLRIVYISGYPEYDGCSEEFLKEDFFLQKPFSRDALVAKVVEALKSSSTEPANHSPHG
jgi:two-component system cell cycle sensor histidine kinase/response regulator CckA